MNINKLKKQLVNFTDKPFRLGQEKAINFALNSVRKLRVICAPTGSGKSLVAIITGMAHGRFLYLCSSKQLQAQIEKEFPEVQVMWGRNNFQCNRNPDRSCSECFWATVDQHRLTDEMKRVRGDCKAECPYEQKKQAVLNHPYQVLNYHYFLTEANFVGMFKDYPIILCDEADTLESAIVNFVKIRITSNQLDKLDIPYPARKSSTSNLGLNPWLDWCVIARKKVSGGLRRVEGAIEREDESTERYGWLLKEHQSLKGLKTKIEIFHNSMNVDWIFDEITDPESNIRAIEFKPVWLSSEISNKFFFDHGEAFVLLSATFPPAQILSKILGVPTGDIDTITLPSTFKKSNRVVHMKPSGDLSYKTFNTDVVGIIKEIESIIAKHPDEKGIIHTVNWKLNNLVMEINNKRLISHNAENKIEQLEEFMSSEKPLVFVSPSSTRGLNLDGDLCRFSIIAKMPYQSLADKLVKTRVYSSAMGNSWYASDAAQGIVQATGRAVRSEKDYSVTYVLDRQAVNKILQYQSLFPKYWMEAVEV